MSDEEFYKEVGNISFLIAGALCFVAFLFCVSSWLSEHNPSACKLKGGIAIKVEGGTICVDKNSLKELQ